MPLHPAKDKWITDFTGVAVAAASFEYDQTMRDAVVSDMTATLDEWKGEIASGERYTLTFEDEGAAARLKQFFGGKARTMDSVDGGGDAMEEVDTWADMPGMQGLTPEEVERIMVAQARIVSMQEKMLAATDADGERLFTDEQIREELWTPLVREGVIPENAVPDRYSKVKEVFDGANKLYSERLADFTAEQADNDELLAKLGKARKFADLGMTVAGNVTSAVVGFKSEEVQKVAELTTTLVDLTMAGGFTVTESVIQRDVEGGVDALTDLVSGVIEAAFPDDPIGKVVGRSLRATVNAAKVGAKVADGDVDGALEALAGYFEDAFALADGVGDDGIGTKIGEWSSFAVLQIRNSNTVRQAIMAPGGPDKASILAAFTQIATDVNARVRATVNERNEPAQETEAEKEAREERQAAELKQAEAIIAGAGDLSGSLLDLGNEDDSDEIVAMKKKLAAMEIAAAQDELEQGRIEFQMMLANGFAIPTDDAEADSQEARRAIDSIDALILQMQKDKAVLATMESLVSTGISIAQQIIPAFGAVGAAMEFAKRAVAAAMRARELNEWLANLEDATAASSVYAEAVRNRVHNSKVQLSQDVIQATFEMAKLVGAVASCSGLAAPVGQAIEKGATAGAAAAELLYEIHKEVELAAAWRVYQEALRTPGNRKAMRKSMRQNPTLAKYTMAYGALVARDAIAMEVVNRCGLSDKVLKNPKSNAHKVVQYMELKFPDDPILERCIPDPQDWHPGTVELTLRSFMLFEAAAPDLEPGQGGGVEGMLSRYVPANAAVAPPAADMELAALETLQAAQDLLIEVIEQLDGALAAFRPRTTESTPHESMRAYLDALAAQATTRGREVRQQRQDVVRLIEASRARAAAA